MLMHRHICVSLDECAYMNECACVELCEIGCYFPCKAVWPAAEDGCILIK